MICILEKVNFAPFCDDGKRKREERYKLTENDAVDKEIEDFIKECKYCCNHPCVGLELEPSLVSIFETCGKWKTNKQVCFLMYSEAVKHIFGTGLGKGVRKKLSNCVQDMIRKMRPDADYTGFLPS